MNHCLSWNINKLVEVVVRVLVGKVAQIVDKTEAMYEAG